METFIFEDRIGQRKNCTILKKDWLQGRHIQIMENYGDEWMFCCTATTRVPGYSDSLEPTQVIIKDTDENEGILEALINAGIVIGATPIGFSSVYLCEIDEGTMNKYFFVHGE